MFNSLLCEIQGKHRRSKYSSGDHDLILQHIETDYAIGTFKKLHQTTPKYEVGLAELTG